MVETTQDNVAPKAPKANEVIEGARLPVAQNEVAQKLYTKLPEIGQVIVGVNPDAFLGSLVAEANLLRLTLSDADLKSPHVQNSFIKAAFNCAVCGLVPGSALGHGYFVPFRNNKVKGKPKMIQLIIGYRGFLDLAMDTGWLIQCDPQVVLSGETIDLYHTEEGPKMRHDIPPFGRPLPDRTGPGAIEAAYCTYRLKGGGASLCFVPREVIARVDKGASSSTPWATHYAEMCMKTAIRRAAKTWKTTRRLATAIMLDEEQERDEVQSNFGPAPGSGETLDLDTLTVDAASG